MLQDGPSLEVEQACADAFATAAALNALTARWHSETPQWHGHVSELHLANFELWHLEDQARDTASGDAAVAATKRSIDRVNQRRNDTVEIIDVALLESLNKQGLPKPEAPLHSETPGQMLDRLSILALKLFHTGLEAARETATVDHRQRNASRTLALREQQDDLASCLTALWRDLRLGQRRFKLYRQMKMYNDPSLNPVLYSAELQR
ncbi:MAG: DUF4254 domain-containing protein [Terriglobus roseus]|nr:DUF4254 domain-containing protein [Terriglobus roseus]